MVVVVQPFWNEGFKMAALGLEDEEDDLIIVLLVNAWIQPRYDLEQVDIMKKTLEKALKRAKDMGVYHPYVYLNYAAEFQKPIRGYGEKRRGWLKEVSAEYDPYQVFQKQVPGGFKLDA